MKSLVKSLLGPLGLVLPALAMLAGACSNSSSSSSSTAPPPCNKNPWECAAGQVCWATDPRPLWSCLPSGTGKLGDPCTSIVGSAVCGDGLACLELAANAAGQCFAICDPADPNHGCASGEHCVEATFGDGIGLEGIHLCAPSGVAALNGGFETPPAPKR